MSVETTLDRSVVLLVPSSGVWPGRSPHGIILQKALLFGFTTNACASITVTLIIQRRGLLGGGGQIDTEESHRQQHKYKQKLHEFESFGWVVTSPNSSIDMYIIKRYIIQRFGQIFRENIPLT